MNKRMGTGSVLVAAGVIALAATSMIGADAASAATTVSGQVMCVDQLPVEGVWIAAGGNSGFANWSPVGGAGSHAANFNRPNVSGSWTVHVGCGGSTSNWRYSVNGNANTSRSYQSWTCYPADITYHPFCQLS